MINELTNLHKYTILITYINELHLKNFTLNLQKKYNKNNNN